MVGRLLARGRMLGVAAATVPLLLVPLGEGHTASGPPLGSATVRASAHHDLSPKVRSLGAGAPLSTRDRGVSGEGDEEETPPLPLRALAPHRADPVVQSSPSSGAMPEPVASFDGLGNVDGLVPPDANGAVGPNDYVEAVNASFAVYSKTGAKRMGPVRIARLWSGFGGMCETNGVGDPIVLYDRLADRWLISEFAFGYDQSGRPAGPYDECVAISQTGDPTGAYYRYAYLISQTKMDDYPKFGVWPDGYYMTVNQFDASGWAGVAVVAFDRSAMLAGDPGTMVYLDRPAPSSYGLLPADMDGGVAPPAGSPEYFVGIDSGNWGRGLELWRMHVDWSNPGATTFGNRSAIPVATFDNDLCGFAANCIPQPAGPGLDAAAYRLMYRLAYRNMGAYQAMVVDQTVDVDGSDHAGIRWYELRDPAGSPYVYQQGTFAPDAGNRWLGSVAMDRSGDIAAGYSVSGTDTFPSVRYAGRLATDPAGTFPRGEATLVAGGGSQTHWSSRWGDYASMSIDPVDDCTFWFTGEYYPKTSDSGWMTRIGAFRFPSCGTTYPTVSVGDTRAPAGDVAAFSLHLSEALDHPVEVTYATADGSARAADGDYTATSGSVRFDPGQTEQTVRVAVSRQAGSGSTFHLVLTDSDGVVRARDHGTATVDPAPPGVAPGGPDEAIRGPGTTFVGTGVFNLTGAHQTRSATVRPGSSAAFVIRVRNDSDDEQRYRLRGPRRDGDFLVGYRAPGLARVSSMSYSLVVPAHGMASIRVVVRVAAGAAPGSGTSFVVPVGPWGRPFHDGVRAMVGVPD